MVYLYKSTIFFGGSSAACEIYSVSVSPRFGGKEIFRLNIAVSLKQADDSSMEFAFIVNGTGAIVAVHPCCGVAHRATANGCFVNCAQKASHHPDVVEMAAFRLEDRTPRFWPPQTSRSRPVTPQVLFELSLSSAQVEPLTAALVANHLADALYGVELEFHLLAGASPARWS